jgi:hydroxyacylglutathione hydrolase
MFVQTFPSGPFSTNAYVVACPQTKQAVIIDPAPDSANAIITSLSEHQLQASQIWLTHSHWDHIAEVSSLKEHYQIPVGIHPLDAANLEQPGSDGLPCWVEIKGVSPHFWLEEGKGVQVGNFPFKILHTPGHSPGSICLYQPQQGLLFSGDTLFKGSIGNLSFPTSQPNLMWNSLNKLAQLPAATVVYPGHGPHTTIGAENWLPHAEEIFG